MSNRIRFIYNPYAGENKILHHLDYVIDQYQQRGYTVLPYRLTGESGFPEAFRGVQEECRYVLVAGGDGTVNGAVNYMKKNGIDVPEEAGSRILVFLDRGCTAIYVGISGRIAGFLALSDTLRDDAPGAISEINDCGTVPVLMTGDGEKAAAYMAERLGIERVYAGCLPEDKLNRIDEYQGTGNQVCMVGDGINDAPALKKAFVGIAMGGVGSDIAVEAADIALINDRICELPHLIRLAKRMMITIKCNLTFSMTLNFVAIILAMTGVLNPVIGALVHNAGSVLVIINSALLLRWKKRK